MRARQTGDLCVLGLHFHLRQITPGILPTPPEDPTRPHAGEAEGHQGGATASNASTYPLPGPVVEAGRDRALCLLRGPNQQQGAFSVPALRDRPLATSASAAQPERRLHMGAYDEAH